jgi:hypothetical protein
MLCSPSMRLVLLAVALIGCASGGDDRSETTDGATDATDAAGGCIFGCEPPAARCLDECDQESSESAGCDGGACVFTTTSRACAFGCNSATGQCHTESSACATTNCGVVTACGGTCTAGCCTMSDYDRTTGLAASGTRACCDDGDQLLSTTDCGVGDNHGVNAEGICAVSWEGELNNGTPCATAHCRKRVCP